MANDADQELQKVVKTVCLIEGEMRDEEGNPVPYKGTGLYFGGGWIMTVAHNFQDDIERNETTHSILSDARFQVKFDVGGQEYVFQEHQRMAFIHHLEPGEDADPKNKDIAMVKLGHQWGYGGRDYPTWEREEHEMLKAMGAEDFALAKIDPPTPKKDETVYAVHFGGANDDKKSEESKILRITPTSLPWYQRCCCCCRLPNQAVPMLHLEKKIGVLPAGSSGCPIMIKKEDKYYLVGLHFSGDADDVDGEAEALPWSQGIHDYIDRGVGIIAEIGSYMGNRKAVSEGAGSLEEDLNEEADKSLKELKRMARDAKLTIYLCNGVVINQQ
ncbi:hypothetical protein OS493_028012 [Desmophyllum pertusum]|uniref:Trypsin-like peptidase domain-containing protein n=1 Tax=Desmophyllum pertusum TaxID=174260 RepID=A0A9W9ZY19_9CNID|nr:hypothetical protein OS493_028012 [Desmophyllum pertusum]